jgi:hypothetical protein
MLDEKMNLPKRHGIPAAIRAAETSIFSKAVECLSRPRYEELDAAKGGALFVAGNYPGPDWESVVGFAPDPRRFYQVTVGIGVDPGQDANLFAKALISRDASSDFCHIVWEPSK